MAAADAVLDLSTLIPERSPFRIDGKTYHLKSPDELSLFESQRFTRWGKRLEELGSDPDREDELEILLAEVAQHAVADVPPGVFGKLNATHHLAIAEVFTLLLLGRQARRAGALVGARPQTGRNSSRASSGLMAAILAGGSTPRRPPSSGPM